MDLFLAVVAAIVAVLVVGKGIIAWSLGAVNAFGGRDPASKFSEGALAPLPSGHHPLVVNTLTLSPQEGE